VTLPWTQALVEIQLANSIVRTAVTSRKLSSYRLCCPDNPISELRVPDINYESHPLTVQHVLNLYDRRELNLNPGFQRDSVWSLSDRRKLIESMALGYPLPAIFLYKREHDGRLIYDVIDGKQRLETILRFTGRVRGKKFDSVFHLPGTDERNTYDWARLGRLKKQPLLTGYRLQVIEVTGDISDIINLFVRINSTGKALTSQEKRHARYYNSYFLKVAGRLAEKCSDTLVRHRILTENHIARMKHVELICELMLSIHRGAVLNTKSALDQVMGSTNMTDRQVNVARDKAYRAIRRTLRLFPDIGQTRFRQLPDFYALVLLIAEFESEGLILTDRKRNRLAADLLRLFSTRVDEVRERQRLAKGVDPGHEVARKYLLTVQQSSDKAEQRKARVQILRDLLESLFAKKDSQRLFSEEQRRILWNSAEKRRCQATGCPGGPITWADFTVDHIQPWSKGGRTALENAALFHRACNSRKGNRSRRTLRRLRGRAA
jgi:5-methylcytosine-specific restriction endonuclease McrA